MYKQRVTFGDYKRPTYKGEPTKGITFVGELNLTNFLVEKNISHTYVELGKFFQVTLRGKTRGNILRFWDCR